IAVAERRRDLPRGDRDGEVPRRDDADNPHTLARDLDADTRADRGDGLAGEPQRLAREELEYLAGTGYLPDALGQRLAFLTAQQRAQFLLAREYFVRRLRQHPPALQQSRARPGGEG